jgi:uncharacterized 2Fe-2S/4Fe-4S cluster protein (DUF4445 family)
MLDIGVIDSTGRFIERSEAKTKLAHNVYERLEPKGSHPAFRLCHKKEFNAVFLSQKDIREVQLAKAAIRAGIQLLQKKMKITDEQIEQVFLAGAFGSYIRRESALRIGLLPAVPVDKIQFVGNAACSGAQMALLSSACRQNAIELARRIQYLEIAHERDFQAVYTDAMLFEKSLAEQPAGGVAKETHQR